MSPALTAMSVYVLLAGVMETRSTAPWKTAATARLLPLG